MPLTIPSSAPWTHVPFPYAPTHPFTLYSLEVVDLEEIEDRDWEFPDRDLFHSSDRDADFKMIRITNDLSEEEQQIVLLS